MKYQKFWMLLLIVPLSLGFTHYSIGLDDINVRDFVFTPLIINQSNTLTFHFFVMARFEVMMSAKVWLSNKTFDRKEMVSTTLSVKEGRDGKLVVTIPPYTATIGLNHFRLTYSYSNTSETIDFALGANYRNVVKFPTSSLILDQYVGVEYVNNVITQTYFLFSPTPFLSRLQFADDLFFRFNALSTTFFDEYQFNYSYAYIVFVDKRHLFPRLPLNIDGNPYLNLQLYYRSGVLSFAPLKPLYVDNDTHIVSLIKDNGFRLTNHLYFPKNKVEELSTGSYQLCVYDFSSLLIDIEYTFSLDFEREFIGSNGTYTIDLEWK